MKFSVNSLCPCGSKKKYKKCCRAFHFGSNAKNALELMKSRYSAYAVSDVKYIMNTTHSSNVDYSEDKKLWSKSILDFCKNVEFEALEILEFLDGEVEAFVTFKAVLNSHGKDCSFVEKSRFLKEDGKWLYVDAKIEE